MANLHRLDKNEEVRTNNGTVNISASFKNLANILSIPAALLISNTAFKIQVLSTSAIKCQSDFRIFQFAAAIRPQKTAAHSTETFVYYIGNDFDIPRHFAEGFDLVF